MALTLQPFVIFLAHEVEWKMKKEKEKHIIEKPIKLLMKYWVDVVTPLSQERSLINVLYLSIK